MERNSSLKGLHAARTSTLNKIKLCYKNKNLSVPGSATHLMDCIARYVMYYLLYFQTIEKISLTKFELV